MITHLTPYLFFNGNCEEALKFYEQALSGDIKQMNRVGEGPSEYHRPEFNNPMMHAELKVGNASNLASDSMGRELARGANVSLSLNFESVDELTAGWKNMGQGATIPMDLQDTLWGVKFGTLCDKFGINWMFNCEIKNKV